MDDAHFALFRTKGEILEGALGPSHFALLIGLIEDRLEEERQVHSAEHENIVMLQVLARGFEHRLNALEERGDREEWAPGPPAFALLIELIEDRLDDVLHYFPPGHEEIVTLRVLSRGFQEALKTAAMRVVPLMPATDGQIEAALALLNAQPSPSERPSSVERPTDEWMQLAAFLAAQGRPVVCDPEQQRYTCQPRQPEGQTDDPLGG